MLRRKSEQMTPEIGFKNKLTKENGTKFLKNFLVQKQKAQESQKRKNFW